LRWRAYIETKSVHAVGARDYQSLPYTSAFKDGLATLHLQWDWCRGAIDNPACQPRVRCSSCVRQISVNTLVSPFRVSSLNGLTGSLPNRKGVISPCRSVENPTPVGGEPHAGRLNMYAQITVSRSEKPPCCSPLLLAKMCSQEQKRST
jgi:hypothetical protein